VISPVFPELRYALSTRLQVRLGDTPLNSLVTSAKVESALALRYG
jgi:hypothetical protein